MILINGERIAQALTLRIQQHVRELKEKIGKVPGLGVILVGDSGPSVLYVRRKVQAVHSCGMQGFQKKLSSSVTQNVLMSAVDAWNHDPDVHGILVQLPLPLHISLREILESIEPSKDVDGFHSLNAGQLYLASSLDKTYIPCTAAACLFLLKQYIPSLEGKVAVVVGVSALVGRPVSLLLLHEGCTVVMTHSKTADLSAMTRQADILVVAAGVIGLIRGDMVKPGAVVIDVGINYTDEGKLVGDVNFQEVSEKASALTPVPRGVGPMTIACLLWNTLQAFCNAHGESCPLLSEQRFDVCSGLLYP